MGLENYRKEWNDKMGAFNRIPLHNWASHAADGLRTGAVGFRSVRINRPSDLLPEPVSDY
jgi:hypothetical protein